VFFNPLGKGKDVVVERGNVIYLEEVRRQGNASSAIELRPVTSPDANLLARRLCQDIAKYVQGPVLLESIASLAKMPKEDAVVAATYAHVRGWVVYADGSVELTRAGRTEIDDASDKRLA
jgi:hypothetical protein